MGGGGCLKIKKSIMSMWFPEFVGGFVALRVVDMDKVSVLQLTL